MCVKPNALAVESFKNCEWLEQPCSSNQGGVRIILDYTHSWYQCCMATAVWDDTDKRESVTVWKLHVKRHVSQCILIALQALVQNKALDRWRFLRIYIYIMIQPCQFQVAMTQSALQRWGRKYLRTVQPCGFSVISVHI